MSNIRYFNQSAPVWDFIASLEEQGGNHPLFSAFNPHGEDGFLGGWSGPRRGGWGGWGGRGGRGRCHDGVPHERRGGSPGPHDPHDDHHGPPRGPHHGPGHEDIGPPHGPPHERHGRHRGPRHEHSRPRHGSRGLSRDRDDDSTIPDNGHAPAGPSRPRSPPPHHRGGADQDEHGPRGSGGHRGRGCGSRGRPGRRGHGGPSGFGRGGPFDLAGLADFFQAQIYGGAADDNDAGRDTAADSASNDFAPLVDVFDTETAFVVHVSLAGANKEKDDIAVHWDHEKSELSISGVIYRPGDEDFLKTLALNERKVGAFSRSVRLGSRAHPAQVDSDGITAKLEDGVLRINVPKEDKDYIEVKMVDIE